MKKIKIDLSMRQKLILIFIVFGLVPFIILGSFSINYSKSMLTELHTELVAKNLTRNMMVSKRYMQEFYGDITLKQGVLYSSKTGEIHGQQDFVALIHKDLEVESAIFSKDQQGYSIVSTSILDTNQAPLSNVYLEQTGLESANIEKGEDYIGETTIQNTPYLGAYMPLMENNEVIGALFIGTPSQILSDEITAKRSRLAFVFSCTVFSLFLVALFSILFISKKIVAPIKFVTQAANQMAKYDLSSDIPKSDKKKDEVGILLSAISMVQENLKHIIGETQQTADTLNTHSLTLHNSAKESVSAMGEIAKATTEITEGACVQVQKINESLDKFEILKTSVQHNIDGTNKIQETSSYIKTLANEGLSLINDLNTQSQHNYQHVQQIQSNIEDVSNHALDIEKISGLISNISSQTNLLALNASIEAARAGELGRGFAVVAEEIQKLSSDTAASTQKIYDLVKKLRESTAIAVTSVTEVNANIHTQAELSRSAKSHYENISEQVILTDTQVIELQNSTQTMTELYTQIYDMVNSLSDVAQNNAAATEQASTCVETQSVSIESLSLLIKSLNELSHKLNQTVSRFNLIN